MTLCIVTRRFGRLEKEEEKAEVNFMGRDGAAIARTRLQFHIGKQARPSDDGT